MGFANNKERIKSSLIRQYRRGELEGFTHEGEITSSINLLWQLDKGRDFLLNSLEPEIIDKIQRMASDMPELNNIQIIRKHIKTIGISE